MDDALGLVRESLDYVRAERLTPSLVWMAEHLARYGELSVDEGSLAQPAADQRLDGAAATETTEPRRAASAPQATTQGEGGAA